MTKYQRIKGHHVIEIATPPLAWWEEALYAGMKAILVLCPASALKRRLWQSWGNYLLVHRKGNYCALLDGHRWQGDLRPEDLDRLPEYRVFEITTTPSE